MILPKVISDDHIAMEQAAQKSYEYWTTIDECLKTFSIFSKTARTRLSHYFLLYWESEYFLSQLDISGTYVIKNGIRWYVTYQECLSPEIIKTNYGHVRLSFRKPEFLDFGFVLVRAVKESHKGI